jgi:hypothetical protein
MLWVRRPHRGREAEWTPVHALDQRVEIPVTTVGVGRPARDLATGRVGERDDDTPQGLVERFVERTGDDWGSPRLTDT